MRLAISGFGFRPGSGFTAAAVCLTLVIGPARAGHGAEIIDRVLAIAAGDVITLTDVHAAREFGLVEHIEGGDPTGEILSRLIDRSLILAEVDRYLPPEPDESAVAATLSRIRARFQTSEAFGLALARVGFDEPNLRGLVREDLRIRAYLDQRFTGASLRETEIERFYRDHPEIATRDGRLVPLDEVRADVVAAATALRRQNSIDEWVRGLRRRAEVVDLYVTGR